MHVFHLYIATIHPFLMSVLPSMLLQISAILKENSNLRAALKTVEQMKMEVENEKVAVQDQVRGDMPHTHTCTHTRAHTHAHTHTCTHTHARTHTRILCISLVL